MDNRFLGRTHNLGPTRQKREQQALEELREALSEKKHHRDKLQHLADVARRKVPSPISLDGFRQIAERIQREAFAKIRQTAEGKDNVNERVSYLERERLELDLLDDYTLDGLTGIVSTIGRKVRKLLDYWKSGPTNVGEEHESNLSSTQKGTLRKRLRAVGDHLDNFGENTNEVRRSVKEKHHGPGHLYFQAFKPISSITSMEEASAARYFEKKLSSEPENLDDVVERWPSLCKKFGVEPPKYATDENG